MKVMMRTCQLEGMQKMAVMKMFRRCQAPMFPMAARIWSGTSSAPDIVLYGSANTSYVVTQHKLLGNLT